MTKIGKRGQLTLFVILAVIIIVAILGYLFYEGYFHTSNIPDAAQPVYSAYTSCIERLTLEGSRLLGSRGGYIETPEFEAGSFFMPSSSQLDFFGVGVPYWFYVSGNNLVREQLPTIEGMEVQLQEYIGENLQNCDFSDFERRGYLVDVDRGEVSVQIEENQIRINLKNELRISFGEEFFRFSEHNLDVDSRIGRMFNLAKSIYDRERKDNFLGNYALDTLTLNAPTSGLEEGCTPIFFNFAEIRNNISEALRENIGFVKVKGDYYTNADEYYIVDIGTRVNKNVNFIYSTEWPTKIEIYGEEFAEPVGLQEGMAMLGFCFVEYQLVYDLVFPVLIQIYDEKEKFQFPVIVLIERNQIGRNLPTGEFFGQDDFICRNRNRMVEIRTSDLGGNPVPARVSFSCLGERCYLGETKLVGGEAYLRTGIPNCIHGFVEARADGYSSGRFMISSNEETNLEVLMKKIYDVELDLGNLSGEALVKFSSDDFSRTVIYPQNRRIQIVEGVYDVTVQVFRNASLTFPARTDKRCFETRPSGIAGVFGGSEARCFDINIPAQEIDRVLIGGGKSTNFISESSLKEFNKFRINVPLFPTPSKIEEINENYIKLEDSLISLSFVK